MKPAAALSLQETADALSVSRSTVRRLVARRAFPHWFKVGDKLIRIPRRDLDAYVKRHR